MSTSGLFFLGVLVCGKLLGVCASRAQQLHQSQSMPMFQTFRHSHHWMCRRPHEITARIIRHTRQRSQIVFWGSLKHARVASGTRARWPTKGVATELAFRVSLYVCSPLCLTRLLVPLLPLEVLISFNSGQSSGVLLLDSFPQPQIPAQICDFSLPTLFS